MVRALVALTFLVLVPRVSAQESARSRTATLSWVRMPGAEACPSTQDVARAVDGVLGRSVWVSASEAELAVEGRIEPTPEGFRATLHVADASGAALGERVLDHTSTDCAEVLEVVALMIALTIDPDATPPEVVEPAVEEPTAPTLMPLAPWRLDLTFSALGSLGLSPQGTLGGGLVLALTPPGFVPIFAHGALYPWSRADVSGGANVDVLQTYFGVGLCPLALRDTMPVILLACLSVDVGAIAAVSGRELVTEPERVTVQANASFGVHVMIAGPLYFAASAALVVPFRSEPFLLRGPPTAVWWRPEPVAGVLALGVGLELPL